MISSTRRLSYTSAKADDALLAAIRWSEQTRLFAETTILPRQDPGGRITLTGYLGASRRRPLGSG